MCQVGSAKPNCRLQDAGSLSEDCMDTNQVEEWLTAGEGTQVEFKERYNSRVIESLVAFANTSGGQVLIGVDDRGRVIGLADADRVAESVMSACREASARRLRQPLRLSGCERAHLSLRKSRRRGGCMPRVAQSLCGMGGRHGARLAKKSGR